MMSQSVDHLSLMVPFMDLVRDLHTCADEWDRRTQAERRDPERNESRLQALKVVNGALGYLVVNDASTRVEDLRAMLALLRHLADLFDQATQRAEAVCAGCAAPAEAIPCYLVSGIILVRAAGTSPEAIAITTTIAANTPERAADLALIRYAAEHALGYPPGWNEGPTVERITS
jgi:hypothetical protein